jgi:NTP pyrophosphatase (non-canonical NTP hydrolase)
MSSASMSHKAVHRGISIVVDGETILNLESNHLSGAPLTTENEAHIRWAIEALLGLLGLPALEAGHKASFQHRTDDWMLACFGPRAAYDIRERSHRFLEEALELVQALGCPESEVLKLLQYVYRRPKGEVDQEIGGVMLTLAALATAVPRSMAACGEEELARVWRRIDEIREKQAGKPKIGVSSSTSLSATTPALAAAKS